MADDAKLAPETLAMLYDAALEKGILGGRPEALLNRLDNLSRDLFPGGIELLSPLMKRGASSAPDLPEGDPERLRRIGDAFLALSGDGREILRQDGRFYTPARIIDAILELVWEDLFPGGKFDAEAGGTVCDPAMGCGFFLLRLIESAGVAFGAKAGELRRWAGRCLYGVDKDPAAVFIARALLWLALSGRDGEFVPDPGRFVCGESLLGDGFLQESALSGDERPGSVDWPGAFPGVMKEGGFAAIIGNPPYEVLTNFSSKPERRVLADAIRDSGLYRYSLSGQINLYRCFVERSLDLLRPGGVLSMIVPLSLTRDLNAKRLRERLIKECRADRWFLYGERDGVFSGVTQSACIFRAWRDGGSAGRVGIAVSGSGVEEMDVAELEACGGGLTIPALAPEGLRVLRWFGENVRGVLADAADSHVGEVDQTFYRECMADEPTGCVLARGAHLSPFRLDVDPAPGRERFLRLDRFLAMKGKTAAQCVERASAPRVAQLGIRNMQSLPRLAAALLPAGVYAGNSLNVFYPREGVGIRYLAGMLNSRVLDWLFRVGSANNNINLHEMRRLPFPRDPGASSVDAVEAAFDRAERIAGAGGGEKELAGVRLALDLAAAECYGLSEDMLKVVIGVRG